MDSWQNSCTIFVITSDMRFTIKVRVTYAYQETKKIFHGSARFIQDNKTNIFVFLFSVLFIILIFQMSEPYISDFPIATTAFRLFTFFLGPAFSVLFLSYRIRKTVLVDMKLVRRDVLRNIDLNELESLDQMFELATMIIGACFTILFFLLPEVYHLSPILIQIVITGMFYIGYKIARIKLALDLRVWIISIGIGTFVMLSIFLGVFILQAILLPIFFTSETVTNYGMGIASIASYLLGRFFYGRKMVDLVEKRIEVLISIQDEIEKEQLKEQLLYPVEKENVPVSIPLTIGVFAILPWFSVSYFDITGSLVIFVVYQFVFRVFTFDMKQYEIFVNPIGPSEGIDFYKYSSPFFPRRIVEDKQIEEIALMVNRAIFGNEGIIQYNDTEYSICRTTRNKLKSLTVGDLFFIEQNPNKYTKEAEKVRNGNQILWVFRLREISGYVVDGEYMSLQDSQYIPLFFAK